MIVLVLSPHTDDGEFGCGGSIARFVSEGHQVHCVAFSAAEQSVPAELPSDILRREVVAATGILGVPRQNLRVLNFTVRDFPAHRQGILETMVKLNDDLKPDIVFLPCSTDTHQDHQTVSREGFRAFKKTTMLGYEVPWNNLTFVTSAFIVLAGEHLEKKTRALEQYKSQADRSYATNEYVSSLARVRGTQIGVPHAEAFEVIRLIRRLGAPTENFITGGESDR